MPSDILTTVITQGFVLWGGLNGMSLCYCYIGRLFGFYHPSFNQLFLLVPWRPVWKAWLSFSQWKERVFHMGRKATAKWLGVLGVLCMVYRPDLMPLGRPLWFGFPLPQLAGTKLQRHAVMIAGTGAGKTTLLQTIIGLHRGAILAVDPKLQVFETMQTARESRGPVYALAPYNPDISSAWNVLDEIEAAIERFGIDAAPRLFLKLAEATILKEPNEKSFFPDTARDLWAGIVGYVYVTQPKECRNLVTARNFLMEGLCPEEFDNPEDAFLFLLSEMQHCKALNGFISKRATAVKNASGNASSDVFATARTQTQWLDLPEVQHISQHSDFLLADLKIGKNPVSVFLGAPVTAIRGELSRWSRLVVETGLYLFETIPGNLKHPCLCALDEFPSLGRIESVETAAPLLRSYGVRLLVIAQDTERLAQAYPHSWGGFLGNADIVWWMGTNHDPTAQYLERSLNQTSRKEKISGGWFSKEPKRYQHRERPLMYADQIKRFLDPDSGNTIVTRFGKHPLKLRLTPYFKELPVWLYEPDPNFREALPRALFRKCIVHPLRKFRKEKSYEQQQPTVIRRTV